MQSSLERWNSTDGVESIIIPIWKRKGNRRECSQYRDISVLSPSSKVFARILEKSIRYIVEPQLSENQFGFRKNKGCSDAIFILRQQQEKHIEWNKPLYMAFIDQEKAFNRIVRAELWKCLAERGIFGELLRAIQFLYVCSQAAVRTLERRRNRMVRSAMCIKTRMCVVAFVIHNIYG